MKKKHAINEDILHLEKLSKSMDDTNNYIRKLKHENPAKISNFIKIRFYYFMLLKCLFEFLTVF